MAHHGQQEFCARVKHRFPQFFHGTRVLDVGSLNVNGCNRGLFAECEYTGIDVAHGQNVDVVVKAHEFGAPDGSFDVVISTEMLEHDPHFAASIPNMVRLLRPGGLLVITCATTGRPEHGTRSSRPQDSPLTTDVALWPDYYRNITELDVRGAVDLDEAFSDYGFEFEPVHCDLYFWGLRSSRPAEPNSSSGLATVSVNGIQCDESSLDPMIVTMIPYSPEKSGADLGAAYNGLMSRLRDDDWACFIDHDACFTTREWYRQLEGIVRSLHEPCVLTCKTNRVGSRWQLVVGVDPAEHSMRYHRKVGKKLQRQFGGVIRDVTQESPMSGVVILVSKKTWRLLGGFVSGFLGVDSALHVAARDAGMRVYLMEGVYVYHWYRADAEDLPIQPPIAAPHSMALASRARVEQRPDTRQNLAALIPAHANRVLWLSLDTPCVPCGPTGPRQIENVRIVTLSPWHGGEQTLPEIETLSDNSYDCVVLERLLENTRQPAELLKRVGRLVREQGTIVANVSNLRHHRVIASLIQGSFPSGLGSRSARVPVRRFTRREFEKLFFECGFDSVDVRLSGGEAWQRWHELGCPSRIESLNIDLEPQHAGDLEEFYAEQISIVARPASARGFPLTSIVIVTHNQLGMTHQCLESIRSRTNVPYELLVVDNGSTDGTLDYLRGRNDIVLIENSMNRGFPAAANQGIQQAKGGQVLLLNNDTVVTTGWLHRMLDAQYSNSNIGLVGPCSNSVSGSQCIPISYGDLSSLDGFAWERAIRHKGEYETTDRLVGFCLLIKRDVIDAIGLLDEQFGIGNFEDDDYCVRALQAGFRLVIARDSFVHHFGHATFRATGVDYADLLSKNETLFRNKWSHGDKNAIGTCQDREAKPFGVRIDESGGLALTRIRCILSACLIVRDNESTIHACLSSIRPWVDELVVVDTGSKDRTPEIAREYGASVYHFPWCDDFSAARNKSLEYANGEWLFWMDSDDTIDSQNGQKLRELAYGVHQPNVWGYVMQVHCPGLADSAGCDITVVDHVKMFRNHPQVRFEGRIHEQVLPSIRHLGGDADWTDIFVVHSGAAHTLEECQRKQQRDLRLLNLELQEKQDHPFVLFNLGMTYADMREHDRAIGYLRRCLTIASPQESHVRKSHALLVGCLCQLGHWNEAATACGEGLQYFPDDPELLFRQGIIEHHFGHLESATRCYLAVLDGHRDRHFTSIDRGIEGFKARHNLALVYEDMDDLTSATAQWEKIVAEMPGYRDGWRGLIDNYFHRNQLHEVEATIRKLEEFGSQFRSEVYRARGRLAIARGEYAIAREILGEGARECVDDDEPLRTLCQFLFEHGDPKEAKDALTSLSKSVPEDASVLHNLGAACLKLDQPLEAIQAFDAALQIRPDDASTRHYRQLAMLRVDAKQSSGV